MNQTFTAPEAFINRCQIRSMDDYKKLYQESITNPDLF